MCSLKDHFRKHNSKRRSLCDHCDHFASRSSCLYFKRILHDVVLVPFQALRSPVQIRSWCAPGCAPPPPTASPRHRGGGLCRRWGSELGTTDNIRRHSAEQSPGLGICLSKERYQSNSKEYTIPFFSKPMKQIHVTLSNWNILKTRGNIDVIINERPEKLYM